MISLKKLHIGDRTEDVIEKVDYNFQEVLSRIDQLNKQLEKIKNDKGSGTQDDTLHRYSKIFSVADFTDNIFRLTLPLEYTTEANITVFEQNADSTYSEVIATIHVLNDRTFDILADIPFDGKVVVVYD